MALSYVTYQRLLEQEYPQLLHNRLKQIMVVESDGPKAKQELSDCRAAWEISGRTWGNILALHARLAAALKQIEATKTSVDQSLADLDSMATRYAGLLADLETETKDNPSNQRAKGWKQAADEIRSEHQLLRLRAAAVKTLLEQV